MTDDLKDFALDLHIAPDWAKEPLGGEVRILPSDDSSTPRRSRPSGDGGFPDRRGGGERRERGPRPSNGGNSRDGGRERSSANRDRDRRGPTRDPRNEERFVPQEAPVFKAASVEVTFLPVEQGLASIIQQVKTSGKAYPLFQIARIFLDKPDRHLVQLAALPGHSLYQCSIDALIFQTSEEVEAHVFKEHFDKFYEMSRVQNEAPKGNFQSVARLRTGELIAPPNHHSYQRKIIALFEEKFRQKMSFERFKGMIETVRDPELIQKWQEETSWTSQFKVKDSGETPIFLKEGEEIKAHFREHHANTVIKSATSFVVPGPVIRQMPEAPLRQAVRDGWDKEFKFPVNFVNTLRPSLHAHALHIFKSKKHVILISAVKPKFFALEESSVSPEIVKILHFARDNPGVPLKKLLAELAPVAPTGSVTYEINAKLKESASAYFTPSVPVGAHEKELLGHIRWLAQEGYLLQYPDQRVELAKLRPPQEVSATAPKEAQAKSDEGASEII
ncbi:MAG: hypothetical protein SGI71_07670 [Verrucomicrobiota bacterium]|nr:hypothetical protein [Verrucomicrobiota bacterium]